MSRRVRCAQRRMFERLLREGLSTLVLVLLVVAFSATTNAQYKPADYVRTEAMIPMRDGVRLYTQVDAPANASEQLPILLLRTPYGLGELKADQVASALPELSEEGYLIVRQDIRGRFKSEGEFVMLRQPRDPADKKAIDESSDTSDTITWLLDKVPNHNGRAGIAGTSYGAWLSVMAMLDPHPALKAVVQQASPADMWLGDDFHHNGAFRLSYGFEYAAMMERGKDVQQFSFDRYDTFDWYLNLGPLRNANDKYLHGKIPTWNDYVAHPDYDEFWKRQTMIPYLTSVKVPTLSVAGWWDQEDFYGPVRIYDELEKHDTQGINYLVVGPWRHGGWSNGTGESLGAIAFGSNTAEYFREQIQAPFFAYYLKDKGTRDFPQAITFEAGANEWKRWDQWPPTKSTEARALYFGANQTLALDDKPKGLSLQQFDEYVSDPAHPVPYRQRPI